MSKQDRDDKGRFLTNLYRVGRRGKVWGVEPLINRKRFIRCGTRKDARTLANRLNAE